MLRDVIELRPRPHGGRVYIERGQGGSCRAFRGMMMDACDSNSIMETLELVWSCK